MSTTTQYVNPGTCEPLVGYVATDPLVILSQYDCLRNSIVNGLALALTQTQEQISENANEIKKLKDAEMLGLVVGEGQQIPVDIADTGLPSYSKAFVSMCITFLIFLIAAVVVVIKKFGATTTVVAGTSITAVFICAIFIALVQRYL